GAWGVIPAHINELSPDRLRGFFPGFAYQVGVLLAASSAYIEARMSHRFGYGMAMAIFAGVVLAVCAVVIAFGPEAHRVSFGEKGAPAG
ncbi:MAG: MFS transporter, partial [Candidatus Acidiferrales bacterium]